MQPVVTDGATPTIKRAGGAARYDIRPEGRLPLQALVIPKGRADTLLVSLHGALDRRTTALPRFERRTSFGRIRAHQLFLADTSLTIDPDMRLAWYLGTETDDLTERYAAFIQDVRDQLGATKVVLAGCSGGGFAAMQLASRIDRSLAIAISPQTAVARYSAGSVRDLARRRLFPAYTSFEHAQRDPAQDARLDVQVRLAASPRTETRIWYVHNTGDEDHAQRFYEPFRAAPDRRVTFIPEFHCPGHNPPSAARVAAWAELGVSDPDANPMDFALPDQEPES